MELKQVILRQGLIVQLYDSDLFELTKPVIYLGSGDL